jgi:hypothetical protein
VSHPAPLPCPFCGDEPGVLPVNPAREGSCWGEVRCMNAECPAQPRVRDDENVSDDRGSDAYKAAAIARWNTRAGGRGRTRPRQGAKRPR